ncbi:hypothetical protein RZS08_11080, partial [Arthrospira platensis SPKY1]|nr:hypothetical protein [Arthrospira platensis SPKY1]
GRGGNHGGGLGGRSGERFGVATVEGLRGGGLGVSGQQRGGVGVGQLVGDVVERGDGERAAAAFGAGAGGAGDAAVAVQPDAGLVDRADAGLGVVRGDEGVQLAGGERLGGLAVGEQGEHGVADAAECLVFVHGGLLVGDGAQVGARVAGGVGAPGHALGDGAGGQRGESADGVEVFPGAVAQRQAGGPQGEPGGGVGRALDVGGVDEVVAAQ